MTDSIDLLAKSIAESANQGTAQGTQQLLVRTAYVYGAVTSAPYTCDIDFSGNATPGANPNTCVTAVACIGSYIPVVGDFASFIQINNTLFAIGTTQRTHGSTTAPPVWWSGSGVPSSSLGSSGDWYIDTVTGNTYSKSGSAWGLQLNIIGPQGPQGPQGAGGVYSYYGSFYDTTTQTPATVNTAQAMTINSVDASNGVSISSGSRILFANTGRYNVQFSAQFQNTDTADHDVKLWLRKNGTDVTGSNGLLNIPSSHGGVPGHSIDSWNYFVNVTAGDYVELWWASDSTSVTLQYYAAGTTPTNPSTASLIVTVEQLVYALIGPQGPTGAQGSSGTVAVNAPITNAGTAGAANLSVSNATTSSTGVIQLANDLTGSATAPALISLGSAGTYGSATAIPIITTDGKGRVSSITTAAPVVNRSMQQFNLGATTYSITTTNTTPSWSYIGSGVGSPLVTYQAGGPNFVLPQAGIYHLTIVAALAATSSVVTWQVVYGLVNFTQTMTAVTTAATIQTVSFYIQNAYSSQTISVLVKGSSAITMSAAAGTTTAYGLSNNTLLTWEYLGL